MNNNVISFKNFDDKMNLALYEHKYPDLDIHIQKVINSMAPESFDPSIMLYHLRMIFEWGIQDQFDTKSFYLTHEKAFGLFAGTFVEDLTPQDLVSYAFKDFSKRAIALIEEFDIPLWNAQKLDREVSERVFVAIKNNKRMIQDALRSLIDGCFDGKAGSVLISLDPIADGHHVISIVSIPQNFDADYPHIRISVNEDTLPGEIPEILDRILQNPSLYVVQHSAQSKS